jgi:hypothetical protein
MIEEINLAIFSRQSPVASLQLTVICYAIVSSPTIGWNYVPGIAVTLHQDKAQFVRKA